MVSQQILCYRLSGLEVNISDELIEKYKKGSKPLQFIDQNEFNFLYNLSLTINDQLKADYKQELFSGFKPFQTSFGLNLNTIETVISFLPAHEGMHIGYSMVLKKLLNK